MSAEQQELSIRNFLKLVEERDTQAEVKRRIEDYAYEFLKVRIESDDWFELEEFTRVAGKCPSNGTKNRYRDVLPYDKTRVHLHANESSCDGNVECYINANFMKDGTGSTAYIATQAPLENTIADFWLMIQQQNCEDILMLCDFIEQGRKKCVRYWPENVGETKSVGNNQTVTLEGENCHAEIDKQIVVRLLRLTQTDAQPQNTRLIRHYQYTNWPDYGKLTDNGSVLRLLDVVHSNRATGKGDYLNTPILVHCSAGCGRTGVVIAIDIVRRQLLSKTLPSEVNVLELVLEMRKQRPSMVQSVEQYMMIYHVIAELFSRYNEELVGGSVITGDPQPPPRTKHQEHSPTSGDTKQAVRQLGSLAVPAFPHVVDSNLLGPVEMPEDWNRSFQPPGPSADTTMHF